MAKESKLTLIRCSRELYKCNSSPEVLFDRHARSFGTFMLPSKLEVRLCWASTDVDPELLHWHSTNSVVIGIDEHVVACDAVVGDVLWMFHLPSSFFEFLIFREHLCVLCEVHALVLNSNGRCDRSIDLPDIATSFHIKNSTIYAGLDSGENLDLGFFT